jgi:hypothetical protein
MISEGKDYGPTDAQGHVQWRIAEEAFRLVKEPRSRLFRQLPNWGRDYLTIAEVEE